MILETFRDEVDPQAEDDIFDEAFTQDTPQTDSDDGEDESDEDSSHSGQSQE